MTAEKRDLKWHRSLLAGWTLVAACMAVAACSGEGAVEVVDGWAERPQAQAPAFVHLRLRNSMGQDVALVGADAEAAASTRLLPADSAQAVDRIPIPSGTTLRIPEDGYRLAIDGADIDWSATDRLNLQLAVEQADGQLLTLSYDLHVHAPGEGHDEHDHGEGHDHDEDHGHDAHDH